jgi:hypothetical protein
MRPTCVARVRNAVTSARVASDWFSSVRRSASSSRSDPREMSRNRANSRFVSRPLPSATFACTERAALRICSASDARFSGNRLTNRPTSSASITASCQTRSPRKPLSSEAAVRAVAMRQHCARHATPRSSFQRVTWHPERHRCDGADVTHDRSRVARNAAPSRSGQTGPDESKPHVSHHSPELHRQHRIRDAVSGTQYPGRRIRDASLGTLLPGRSTRDAVSRTQSDGRSTARKARWD